MCVSSFRTAHAIFLIFVLSNYTQLAVIKVTRDRIRILVFWYGKHSLNRRGHSLECSQSKCRVAQTKSCVSFQHLKSSESLKSFCPDNMLLLLLLVVVVVVVVVVVLGK